MRNLSDKLTLITGAGHGLGRELALAFAREGSQVVATDMNPELLDETRALIESEAGQLSAYLMDVTRVDQVLRVRDQIHEEHGRIDILVNNAGIVIGGDFLEVPLERHLATLEVNACGPVIVAHAFLPDLISQPEGHCVTIASACGIIPSPNGSSYSSSKFAALGFTESIREELRLAGHHHVRVTAVCPSYIDTGMFEGVGIPLLTRPLPPAQVAQKVIRAVQRQKAYLLTPWIVNLIPLGKALLPLKLAQWICDRMGVTSGMYSWCGSRSAKLRGQAVPETPPQPALLRDPA